MDYQKISAKDDQEFATWCALRSLYKNVDEYTEAQFKTVLTGLNIPYKDSSSEGGRPSSKRGPLEIGEVVIVRADKCSHELNMRNCKALNFSVDNPIYFKVENIVYPSDNREFPIIKVRKIDDEGKLTSQSYDFYAVPPSKGTAGIVKEIKKQEEYRDSGSARFKQAKLEDAIKKLDAKALEPNDSLGLYRSGLGDFRSFTRYMSEFQTREVFEVVYKRGLDIDPPEYRTGFSDRFIDTSFVESQDIEDLVDERTLRAYGSMYFRTPIGFFAINSKGEVYAQLETKLQRGTQTAISPSVGKVFYIGKVGQRPPKWREELAELIAEHLDSN